jgi:hypothetical protein
MVVVVVGGGVGNVLVDDMLRRLFLCVWSLCRPLLVFAFSVTYVTQFLVVMSATLIIPATSPRYRGLVLTMWKGHAPVASRMRWRVYWRGRQVRVRPRLEGLAATFTTEQGRIKVVAAGYKSYSLECQSHVAAALLRCRA